MDLAMSALPSEADIRAGLQDVCFVPEPDICFFTQLPYRHSRRAQEVLKRQAAWLS
jgi:hypothetical protein